MNEGVIRTRLLQLKILLLQTDVDCRKVNIFKVINDPVDLLLKKIITEAQTRLKMYMGQKCALYSSAQRGDSSDVASANHKIET